MAAHHFSLLGLELYGLRNNVEVFGRRMTHLLLQLPQLLHLMLAHVLICSITKFVSEPHWYSKHTFMSSLLLTDDNLRVSYCQTPM
jgi:hypothetical protein